MTIRLSCLQLGCLVAALGFFAEVRQLPAQPPSERDEREFLLLDENEDGRLSGTEAKAVLKYDLNGDGKITKAEFLAGRSKDRGQPAPATAGNTPVKPKTPVVAADAKTEAWNRKLAEQFAVGKKWAILIGVDKYPTNPLRFCVSDARLLALSLEKHGGFARERILLLTDDQPRPEMRPTKSNMQTQVLAMLKKVGERDTVLVYFAGHGGDFDGQSFFCPLDFDSRRAKITGWRAEELRGMLHDCGAMQKLLVIDCCHSGRGSTGGAFGNPPEVSERFDKAQGLITFAACTKSQESAESSKIKHGCFTFALVEGLQGAADFDKNGIVDSDELYRHALVEVPFSAKESDPRNKQTPIRIIGEDVVGVFALSRPDGVVVIERKGTPRPKPGDVLVNSIGQKLVFVPPGMLVFGSPKSEYQRGNDEAQVPMTIATPLYFGAYEVTQAEYAAIMGKNPSYFSPTGTGSDAVAALDTDRLPVEQVSWQEAVEFCTRLNSLPAERKARRTYRLPTEAEWEYGCRANTASVFNVGELISGKQANIRADRPYLDSPEGPFLGRTCRVGLHPPNAFGLYDMHGNVSEWCHDWYTPAPHISFAGVVAMESKEKGSSMAPLIDQFIKSNATGVPVDPTGPKTGETRVVRGGSYTGDVQYCRSAARRHNAPDYRYRANGFRVVCVVAPDPDE